MGLYYATTNKRKLKSLQRELDEYGINVLQVPMNILESRSADVQEIAGQKVVFAYTQLKEPCVALDAGFYIHSLNGFPKAFVNFVLGTIGLEGILELVKDKDRNCEFRECLAYMDDSLSAPEYFTAHVRGIIAPEPRGVMKDYLWSELALIFIPERSKKTLGEMSHDQYLEWCRVSREKESSARLFCEWFTSQQ